MADVQKLLLRTIVDNVYDIQATRIAAGNRIIASLRQQGIVASKNPDSLNLEAQKKGKSSDSGDDSDAESKENDKLLIKILEEYRLVSKVYAERFSSRGSVRKALEVVKSDSVYIQTEFTYSMISTFLQLMNTEQSMVDICAKEVKKHPLWDAFFKDVKGCGPLMSAVCIAYLDPFKARWPSAFWKYCGLDVIHDENGSHGRGRSDAYMVTYIDKNGEEKERRSLGYNPVLKTKLVGVLGTSFLRAGKDAKYAAVYYDYKNRLQNRPDCADLRAVVIHRRAIRYAVKMFLRDLWYAWRTIEGLETGEPYEVAKLGMAPHHDPRNAVNEDAITKAQLRLMNF